MLFDLFIPLDERRQKLIYAIRELPTKTQASLQEKQAQIQLAKSGYYDKYSLYDAIEIIRYSIRIRDCIISE